MKYSLAIITIAFYSCICISCKKLVAIDPPRNQLVVSSVFSDSVNASAAVNGIYINLVNTSSLLRFGNGIITVLTGLASDELNTNGVEPAEVEFYNNSVSIQNSLNSERLWRMGYSLIYHANASIEGLTESSGITTSLKSQLIGECLVIRSLIYFNLINIYGDVPLVLTTDYEFNAKMPRTSVQKVYQQIISDLEKAEEFLGTSYASTGRARPNKYVAAALLARIYLYTEDWEKANIFSDKVINAGIYTLSTDLNTVFVNGSAEALWQLPPVVSTQVTAEGTRFIPSGSSAPRNAVSNLLLQKFAANDGRKAKWIKKQTVNVNGVPTDFYYPFKYKLRVPGTPAESYMIFRLAEQYLIRAEARAQQNSLADALADVNTIRRRAGLLDTTGATKPQVLSIIEKERQLELFCEWGHRWFDLKRTNQVHSVLSVLKGSNWQITDALFPIPFGELQANPFLVQNPGY